MVDNYYKVGGSLNANHGTYVVREADEQIFQLLKAGKYCFVFNSRQMGKSSLRVKAMKKLKAEGIRCASIDLTIIGSNIRMEKWYKGFANQLLSKLELDEVDLNDWWNSNQGWTQLQRLNLLIESVILNKLTSNIVIFLDEIDVLLKSDFKDDFFAFIRACYNQRADDANFERLTFCLLGVATPGDLSQEKGRTPFNIGSSVELTGFSFESAKNALMPGLENVEHPEAVLQSVLNWTGGQPFLTQKLCSLIVQQTDCCNLNINQLVQKYIIQNWESQDDPEHLRTIRDRLLYNEQKAGRLLGLYQQVLNSHTCSDNLVVVDGSDEQTQLRLSGLVVKKSGYLQIYNPIYQSVFNSAWLKHELDKLRPYSEAINRWLNSNRDRSWLLQEKALHDAQAWAKGKSLSDLDYQFINASQEISAQKAITEKEAQIKANQILARANQKGSRIIRTGGVVAFILVVASLIGVIYAHHELDTAKKATALTQAGNNAAQQFESKQLDALVSAMQAGQDLKELVKYKHSLGEYQTITPLTTLLNILVKIREYNQFDSAQTQLNNLSFSPDGIIASSSDDGTIKLWKQDGTGIKTLFEHKDKITSVTFSPDGKIIASSSDDGTIKLWNHDGTLITTLSGHKGKVISVTDTTIASSSNDQTVKLWRLDGTLIKTCPVQSSVTSSTFSRNGKIIAFGTENGTVELCQPDGGVAIPQAHKGWVTSVSFSPNGKIIASSSDDGTIKLWNTDNNQIKTIQGHTARINSVSFSPDGKTIASSSNDQTVKLWKQDGNLITTLTGYTDSVGSAIFSPDGKTLAASSEDGVIKLWKLNVGMDTLTGYKQQVTSATLSPDGKIIASASDDKTIQLWKTDGTLVATLPHQHQGWVTSVSFSPNGNILASASDDGTIQLWTDETPLIILRANALVTSVSFSPDGKILASASDDGTIQLWKLDGTLVATLPERHKNWVTSVSFSPDGNVIASGGDDFDPTIKLWKLDGTLVATLKGHTKDINSISFSPDGTLIASGSNDQTIKLWKSDGGKWNYYNTLTGHSDRVTSVSFSPDGKTIVSGSDDKTIKLWKTDGTGIDTLTGHRNRAASVSFSPVGNIVSVSQDGQAIEWNLNLDNLLTQGCQWLQDYFVTHPQERNRLKVCARN